MSTSSIQSHPNNTDARDKQRNQAKDYHDSSLLQFSELLDGTRIDGGVDPLPDEHEPRRSLSEIGSDYLPADTTADDLGRPERGYDLSIGADDTYANLDSHSDAPPLRSVLDLPRQSVSSQSQHSSRHSTRATSPYLDAQEPPEHHIQRACTSSPAAAAADRSQSRTSRPSHSAHGFTHDAAQDSTTKPEHVALPDSTIMTTDSTLRSGHSLLQTSRPVLLPDRTSDLNSRFTATGRSSSGFSMQVGDAHRSRPTRRVSRIPSEASVASSMMSDLSVDSDRGMPGFYRGLSELSSAVDEPDFKLGPLPEEHSSTLSPPITPRAITTTFAGATDTVIAQHVQNIRVPDTIAQEFRQRHPNIAFSPDKRPNSSQTSTTSHARPQSTLTLKEQNSKVDKLTKENFDLKLKIHFLDQALQNRSDEGVKDMINQNVQLQTDLLKERKDAQGMRRRTRELESKIEDLQNELAHAHDAKEAAHSTIRSEYEATTSELREQIDHLQVRITKLSADNLASNVEKRKLADHIASLNNRRHSSYDAEEATAMWKNMVASEVGRREQAETDARKLREELLALRSDRHLSDRRKSSKSPLEHGFDRNGALTSSSITLIDHLRTENLDLRRDLGAQTSMLTSRNKERERLQQEVEELKLLQRKTDSRRSMSGYSGFERPSSRAYQRFPLRPAGSRPDEFQSEEYERRESILLDKNARLTQDHQTLEEEYKLVESELNSAVEDLRSVQKERDDALHALEDRDLEYDRLEDVYKELEEEAVLKIEGLEETLAHTERLCEQSKIELHHKAEDYTALQAELKGLGTKHQRLEVQQESLQNEISFLREEQEGDKIKIGDLEHSLQAAEQAVLDEHDKVKELQDSLDHERGLHETLKAQSNEEHQRILNDLASNSAQSKDDALQLRRSLSQMEREAKTSQGRLQDLEEKLRDALGDPQGTHASFVQRIEAVQSDLIKTFKLLEEAQAEISDKDRLIKNRETMLENTNLESRHLSDLLEKERRARKHDLHQFEMSHRGNSTHLRIIAQHETKVLELETARNQDKRKAAGLEQQIREQLNDRNNLLHTLWTRLTAVCGPDWTQMHSAVDGRETSVESIAQSLPFFKRNMIDAIKKVESLSTEFKTEVRAIERRLDKNYSSLEHHLESRSRRVEQLERAQAEMQPAIELQKQKLQEENSPRLSVSRSSSTGSKLLRSATDDYAKLKAENKQLKSELGLHRQYPSTTAKEKLTSIRRGSSSGFGIASPKALARLLRSHGSSAELSPQQTPPNEATTDSQDSQQAQGVTSYQNPQQATHGTMTQDERWAHRYAELEKRLKAEREARLLDRRGARQRLDARDTELEELQAKLKRLGGVGSSATSPQMGAAENDAIAKAIGAAEQHQSTQ